MKEQVHERILVELYLENRFAERYKETFELIITSLSKEVSCIPGKWFCTIFAQNYSVKKCS
jgi:hypothetical protein